MTTPIRLAGPRSSGLRCWSLPQGWRGMALALGVGLIVALATIPASAQQGATGTYWQCVPPSTSNPNGGYCPVNTTYPLPVTLVGTVLGTVQQIANSNIPLIMSSTCTMGDNGAISVCTALPGTYTASYTYWPLNTICTGGTGGNVAGWYYTVWSSTTAGTIYRNTYSSGTPLIPASPTAFSCTAGTGVQGTGADITAFSYTIPAGTINGINDSIWFSPSYSINSSGNNKILKSKIGTTPTVLRNVTLTTNATQNDLFGISNSGSSQVQVSSNSISGAVGAASTSPLINLTLDTTGNLTFIVTMQLATATDYAILNRIGVEVHKGVP